MKVLMINSVCGIGSTGRICTDIAEVLNQRGDECIIAYGQGITTYANSFKIGSKIENHLHNIGSRIFGKQGYFSANATKKLIAKIQKENPDVIHLHNLHGNYLNLEILFSYLKDFKGKIVWTLHDCWAFTGNCGYYSDVACFKWKTNCEKCPQLMKYPPSHFFDQTKQMFYDKKALYGQITKMTIQPVSKWLESEVRQSILKNFEIKQIYNWIRHDIFKPYDNKKEIFEKYELDKNKKVVLGISAGWSNNAKFNRFLELSKLLDETFQLVLVGESNIKMPTNIKHINYVNGREQLAMLYSAADVYVHLSTEDTFGLVIAEAMSCGTPAIVLNSTACAEIVGSSERGAIIDKNDISGIYNAIISITRRSKDYYSDNCRNRVIDEFDYTTNINKVLETYN